MHYSAEYFILAVMCDKVGRDGSECPGVECVLEWGVSDKEGHKIHKENTRFLYIEAHNDWDEFTENWQQEVNQLMKAIQGLINPLIIDPLPKDIAGSAGTCQSQDHQEGAVGRGIAEGSC